MSLKENILSKIEKIFRNNPLQSEQKPTSGHIHKSKKKQSAKRDWTRFVLKLCQLKLKICSSNCDRNISALIFYWEASRAHRTAIWFVSRATFWDCRVLHAIRRLFWAKQQNFLSKQIIKGEKRGRREDI